MHELFYQSTSETIAQFRQMTATTNGEAYFIVHPRYHRGKLLGSWDTPEERRRHLNLLLSRVKEYPLIIMEEAGRDVAASEEIIKTQSLFRSHDMPFLLIPTRMDRALLHPSLRSNYTEILQILIRLGVRNLHFCGRRLDDRRMHLGVLPGGCVGQAYGESLYALRELPSTHRISGIHLERDLCYPPKRHWVRHIDL